MLDYARPGDTVVVTAIDRLGRSVAEVTRTIVDLGDLRIILRALREGVNTATPTGRAVAAIMATLAELELELGRERRAASRDSRRARQLPATKPYKLSGERQEQLRRLASSGEPVHELAKAFGIGRATAYRYLTHSGEVAEMSEPSRRAGDLSSSDSGESRWFVVSIDWNRLDQPRFDRVVELARALGELWASRLVSADAPRGSVTGSAGGSRALTD
jgi:hypothetical protein